ncbi:ABC transporter substrate-binding protein [Ancylobacter sp. MQZ15Z-1]|uniref:ABC transporter substrate-binding protein n=1 Tax=Ancylobacter mangrovi TaxID=2972472 RepID=A0A9X2PKF8_9HYPH|nr:ABC transporter substrate-binding protein [Ancylobacter mangrovi]MCS0496907.1 ABC transporter substrate-binding protein [Ancylobacter mangrovi]
MRVSGRRIGIDRRRFLAGAALLCAPAGNAAANAAPRPAAVDWAAAECLLALRVAPIAIADIATYRQWLPEFQPPLNVRDLGARTEPNLELLAELVPDRIFISNWQGGLAALLQRIAPVEVVTIIDARTDAMDNAREAFTRIASATGQQEAASSCLSAFDAALAEGRGALARVASRPVYVGVLHENGTQLFLYGKGSWVHSLMLRLGLRNALTTPTSAFGNALVDIAELAAVPDAVLLYLDQGARTRRAERELRASTLWQGLPMVKEGRARTIPAFYALGGVPSIWRTMRLLVAALDNAPTGRGDG